MLWALLFSLLFAEGEANVLLNKELKKEFKHSIEDKQRRKEVMVILDDFLKNDIKAFKTSQKQRQSKREDLFVDVSKSEVDLGKLHRAFLLDLAAIQLTSIYKREEIASKMHTEEWDELLRIRDLRANRTKRRNERRIRINSKKELKLERKLSSLIQPDSQRVIALASLRNYSSVRKELIEWYSRVNYSTNEVIRNRQSSKESLALLFKEINGRRDDLYRENVAFRKSLIETTDKKGWSRIAKRAADYY